MEKVKLSNTGCNHVTPPGLKIGGGVGFLSYKHAVPTELNMIQELDTVVLAHNIDQYGLKQDDIGAVVHRLYSHII